MGVFIESLQLQIFERTREKANIRKNERKRKYSKEREKMQIFERTRVNVNIRKNECAKMCFSIAISNI